jgi:hypothetical protein
VVDGEERKCGVTGWRLNGKNESMRERMEVGRVEKALDMAEVRESDVRGGSGGRG